MATIHQSTTNLSKLDKLSAPEPHKTNQICLVSPDSSPSLNNRIDADFLMNIEYKLPVKRVKSRAVPIVRDLESR